MGPLGETIAEEALRGSLCFPSPSGRGWQSVINVFPPRSPPCTFLYPHRGQRRLSVPSKEMTLRPSRNLRTLFPFPFLPPRNWVTFFLLPRPQRYRQFHRKTPPELYRRPSLLSTPLTMNEVPSPGIKTSPIGTHEIPGRTGKRRDFPLPPSLWLGPLGLNTGKTPLERGLWGSGLYAQRWTESRIIHPPPEQLGDKFMGRSAGQVSLHPPQNRRLVFSTFRYSNVLTSVLQDSFADGSPSTSCRRVT